MAPKPTEAGSQPQLPSTTDFNALYNRISLAATKQNTFLQSMRSKYPSLQQKQKSTRPQASSLDANTPTDAPSTSSKSSGFSALRNSGTLTPSAKAADNSSRNPFGSRTKAQLRAEQERDDVDFLKFEPPNTGLGYKPSKAETEADAATQELSRKLLGKKGRQGTNGKFGDDRNNSAAAKKRAAAEEEDSDEEEGRSGLGRRKKRTKIGTSDVVDELQTERNVASVSKDMDTGDAAQAADASMSRDAEVPEGMGDPEGTAPLTVEPKKEEKGKKKKKKNKSKKQKSSTD